MSKSMHPSDGIIISKKWLEGEIKRVSECKYAHTFDAYHRVLENSQPLKPVLEMAYDIGYVAGCPKVREEFLNNIIQINEYES